MHEAAVVVLAALLGGIIGGGAITGLVWQAAENKLRQTFATKEEMKGHADRIDADLEHQREAHETITKLHTRMGDRVGRLEGQVTRLEERQTQQWLRMVEQMNATAQTLRETVKELDEVTTMVTTLAAEVRAIRSAHIN